MQNQLVIDQKRILRNTMIAFRRLLPPDVRRDSNDTITQALIRLPNWTDSVYVCIYMSRTDEVDTTRIIEAAVWVGKTLVIPRVSQDSLSLHIVRSVKDFIQGAYDILEPKMTCPCILPEQVDLFIVPGLAFDRVGFRVGYGKGYYDKLLAGVTAPKIGLAYAFQVLTEVPHSSYDVPMTMVVTEKEVLNFR